MADEFRTLSFDVQMSRKRVFHDVLEPRLYLQPFIAPASTKASLSRKTVFHDVLDPGLYLHPLMMSRCPVQTTVRRRAFKSCAQSKESKSPEEPFLGDQSLLMKLRLPE